jgi:hypothetical protein
MMEVGSCGFDAWPRSPHLFWQPLEQLCGFSGFLVMGLCMQGLCGSQGQIKPNVIPPTSQMSQKTIQFTQTYQLSRYMSITYTNKLTGPCVPTFHAPIDPKHGTAQKSIARTGDVVGKHWDMSGLPQGLHQQHRPHFF